MDDLLRPIQTTFRTENDKSTTTTHEAPKPRKPPSTVTSADDVIEICTSRPDQAQLLEILQWLDRNANINDSFNIRTPGPQAARILYILVNDVVPDYWTTLFAPENTNADGKQARKLLSRCLRSIAGLGAIVSRLRLLLDQNRAAAPNGRQQQQQGTEAAATVDRKLPFQQCLQFLELLLQKDDLALTLWRDSSRNEVNETRRSLQWKEVLALLASGRLLSVASETNELVNQLSTEIVEGSWLGDGKQYASWWGSNVRVMLEAYREERGEEVLEPAAQALGKGLRLGFEEALIEQVFARPLNGDENAIASCQTCIGQLSHRDQKVCIYSCIRILNKGFGDTVLGTRHEPNDSFDAKRIGGSAALLEQLIAGNAWLQDALIEWVTSMYADTTSKSNAIQRIVALAISADLKNLRIAFERTLDLFGDKLFIKHTPVWQQDVQVQTLLVLTGHLYRADKTQLSNITRSSLYLNAISNRLAASSERPRFWGMLLGNVVSEMLDPEENRMNFTSIDMDAPEVAPYRKLAQVEDEIGVVGDMKNKHSKRGVHKTPESSVNRSKQTEVPLIQKPQPTGSKIISIEEIEDESESEEDDLPVYENMSSDASDSEEDPELVRRNKPTVPVYIQDIVKGLRELEDYDRNRLALQNAASLIRRKAAFGTEVTDNAEELANILVGLNDKYEMEGFQENRLKAMIAILVADPRNMGPWFAAIFYNGDYSISQRASILTTLGLGAREVSGIGKEEDAKFTGAFSPAKNPQAAFPSKQLPPKLHQLYSIGTDFNKRSLEPSPSTDTDAPLSVISSELEKSIIRPLAASAADALTGPSALKVRTFSSRMAVEQKRAPPSANPLAKIAADGFLFPLIGRWQMHIRSASSSGNTATRGGGSNITSPYLLSTLLRTFALIIHAAGPTMVQLPRVTSEIWGLVLAARGMAAGTERKVMEGLLFAVLTLLEVNLGTESGGRRVAEEHARELLETREWVEGVVENAGGSIGVSGEKGDEDERVGMLAAAVLVRCREVVEKYQRLLMGDMLDFM